MEVQNKDRLIKHLCEIEPSQLDFAGFITLTNYINTADGAGQTYDKAIFRLANDKLVLFSKTRQAWPVCLQVLKGSCLVPTNVNEF